jgi:hypothetical protein
MGNKDIKENFTLSTQFSEYIIHHPVVMRGRPQSARIVFIPEENKDLAEKNRKMAHEIARKQHKRVYGAIKTGNSWAVKKLEFKSER